MKPKRETAEQRARRIGRGLGFYLMLLPEDGDWWIFEGAEVNPADGALVKVWRALERSQRALARARGVRT